MGDQGNKPARKTDDSFRKSLSLLGLGAEAAAVIGLCVFAGWHADRWLGWTPVLTLFGLAFGLAGMFAKGWYDIQQLLKTGTRFSKRKR